LHVGKDACAWNVLAWGNRAEQQKEEQVDKRKEEYRDQPKWPSDASQPP